MLLTNRKKIPPKMYHPLVKKKKNTKESDERDSTQFKIKLFVKGYVVFQQIRQLFQTQPDLSDVGLSSYKHVLD